jgi:uncharacterized protein (UPF0335 family)
MALMDETDAPDTKADIREYIERYRNLKNEESEIKERLKELKEEFKDRVDMKELARAMTIVKAEAGVRHQFEFDSIVDVLRKDFAVLP